MSKKRKKIKVVRIVTPTVRIPVEKVLEELESPEEPRERLGESCDGCFERKNNIKKVGKRFLCPECREEELEEV